ncbi:MAG: rhomboid family intramembrane serine protease [Thermoproteota archaeon]
MFPAGDETPRYSRPIVTYLLIGVNVGVFIIEWFILDEWGYELAILRYGFIPRVLTVNPADGVFRMFTSMFLHADPLHILGNMIFLYIFGDNVEDRMGHVKYFFLYLFFGVAASLMHYAIDPASIIPAIGASGAISGVMGAYLVMFPYARVRVFYRFFLVRLPAVFYLGFWFLMQLVESMLPGYTGIAYWAHIGGFIAGMIVALLFFRRKPSRPSVQYYYYYRGYA